MKRAVAALTMSALLIGLGGIPQAGAQTTFIWTGFHENKNFSAANNWKGNAVPTPLDGTILLSFPSAENGFVSLDNSIDVLGLVAAGHLHIGGGESNLNLGAGGISFAPPGQATHLVFDQDLYVVLGANQNWTVSNGAIEVRTSLSGTGVLTKLGDGELVLRHGNSNSGGINLNAGKLVLGANDGVQSTALGSGVLTIGAPAGGMTPPPTLVTRDRLYDGSSDESSVLIANNIVLNGVLSTINQTELILTGGITLNTNTTITTRGQPLYLQGAISEATSLKKITVDGKGVVVLTGANTYTGGTTVNQGGLVFASSAAVPAAGSLTVAANGYLGFGFTTGYGALIGGGTSRFDKANTAGSIGFDSDLDSTALTFAEAIDLTGFNPLTGFNDLPGFNASARIGSASHAVISGSITPQGNDYRFGGGGGHLTVSSQLTGARNVVLDSPSHSPLTVRLTNTAITNNFTGNVTATHSGIIFGSNVKLPTGLNQLTPLLGGYIGTAHSSHFESPTALNNYLPLFSASTTGVIGFDLAIGVATTRVVDLTGATYTSLINAYLGTSSTADSGPGIRFTGTISPNSSNIHRFAAFKGGVLEVAGTLPGNSLVIGHPDALSLFADRTRGKYSTVIVSGNNGSGLAGGTTFYGGHLVLGQSNGTIGTDATNALGSGTLTIAPVTFEIERGHDESTPTPFLSAAAPDLIFNNAIVLNTDLDLGGNNNFTLGGNISGSGELYVGEDIGSTFSLTLGGNNSFTGGVYVGKDTTLWSKTNSATGLGLLSFGSTNGKVYFDTAAPEVYGLRSGQNDFSYLYAQRDNAVLKIIQNESAQFRGEIRSNSESDNLRFVKSGTADLRLESGGLYYYYGTVENSIEGNPSVSLEVKQGALILNNSFYIEDSSPHVWVNGGTLVLEGGKELYNPLIVSSGTLAGNGTYSTATIGTGAMVSPGFGSNPLGTLTFSHLTLASEGVYEWNIQSANLANTGARDLVNIYTTTTLELTASAGSPFVIRPVTLTSAGIGGILGDVDPSHGMYSWTLMTYYNITGATQLTNPSNLALDVSQFQSAYAGTFSLQLTSLTGTGSLMLNFTPVPEPSTYALMIVGLGLIALQLRRRSRANRHRS